MKIVADKDIPFIKRLFSTIGDVHLVDGRQVTTDLLSDADLLIVRTVTPINERLLQDTQIKFVASATTGIDHIDMQYLQDKNIGFAYAPGCNARAVAEYVLSVMFIMCDRLNCKLIEKTVGIIGCGHVGSQVLEFLRSLGIACIVNDPPLNDNTGDECYRSLDEVLSADIITLHVPLVKDGNYPTLRMLDQTFLQSIRDNAILVNTSRGQVVNEKDLLGFMDNNKQLNVILDVWTNEPEINPALLSRAKIGTPHIAGYSIDGKIRAIQCVMQQVCDYFDLKFDESLLAGLLDNAKTEITVSNFNSDIEAVQLAVLASYDVRSDGAALRGLLEISKNQRADYFDDLRNSYPLRREFNNICVKLPSATDSLQGKLIALGFNVATTQ